MIDKEKMLTVSVLMEFWRSMDNLGLLMQCCRTADSVGDNHLLPEHYALFIDSKTFELILRVNTIYDVQYVQNLLSF